MTMERGSRGEFFGWVSGWSVPSAAAEFEQCSLTRPIFSMFVSGFG